MLSHQDGHLNGQWFRSQAICHTAASCTEISAFAVHFVDEGYGRHAIASGLPPHRLSLSL
jgi:hypothetical protein